MIEGYIYKVRVITRGNKELYCKYYYNFIDVKKFVLNLDGYRTIEKINISKLTNEEIALIF